MCVSRRRQVRILFPQRKWGEKGKWQGGSRQGEELVNVWGLLCGQQLSFTKEKVGLDCWKTAVCSWGNSRWSRHGENQPRPTALLCPLQLFRKLLISLHPLFFQTKEQEPVRTSRPELLLQEVGNTFPVLLFMSRLSPLSLSCWGDGCGATTTAAPVRVMDLEASSDQSGMRVEQQPYGSL